MPDKLIVLSDIHANLTALNAVLEDISDKRYRPDGIILLGDIINYGMRPNEVIEVIRGLRYPVLINLMGNHEKALFDRDLSHFSTERGKKMLEYTSSILSEKSRRYLRENLNSDGIQQEVWDGRSILFVHGSVRDPYWGKMTDESFEDETYKKYDYVFSGHSHLPYNRSVYYRTDNPVLRNKKKTVFINPGSVGQPRNQNPCAQYAYIELSTGTIHNNAVPYDVEKEYILYPDSLDKFYKERLLTGI